MATASSPPRPAPDEDFGASNWTASIRRFVERRFPLANLLPDRQPFYVGSWVYVFGVVADHSLVWVIGSGVVLAFFGPGWWHVSSVGRFVNSIHFWSVQLFFLFTVLHLWGQYFMASWRDGRATTWIVGVVIFLAALSPASPGTSRSRTSTPSGSRSTRRMPSTRRVPASSSTPRLRPDVRHPRDAPADRASPSGGAACRPGPHAWCR